MPPTVPALGGLTPGEVLDGGRLVVAVLMAPRKRGGGSLHRNKSMLEQK